MNYGTLPVTGAGLTIGGLLIEQTTLLAIGISLIVVGAMLIRFRFRHGKTPADI